MYLRTLLWLLAFRLRHPVNVDLVVSHSVVTILHTTMLISLIFVVADHDASRFRWTTPRFGHIYLSFGFTVTTLSIYVMRLLSSSTKDRISPIPDPGSGCLSSKVTLYLLSKYVNIYTFRLYSRWAMSIFPLSNLQYSLLRKIQDGRQAV